jgi:hypothetical protein
MSRKSKKTEQEADSDPTATAIATRAGCSRQLVSRLLTRGFSEQQIIDRIAERKRRTEARIAGPPTNGKPNGHDMDFPVIPVAEEPSFPPYSQSEAKVEFHLAEKRELEVARLRRELMPLQPAQSIIRAAAEYLMNRLRSLPEEAQDRLGSENTEWLRAQISHICDEARQVESRERVQHGLPPLPPALPDPVRKRLADYEHFLKGTNQIIITPDEQRIDSMEWRRLHPKVTFDQVFVLLRKKREWEQKKLEHERQNLELERERAEWDLPPEIPDDPAPPDPPEEEPEAA